MWFRELTFFLRSSQLKGGSWWRNLPLNRTVVKTFLLHVMLWLWTSLIFFLKKIRMIVAQKSADFCISLGSFSFQERFSLSWKSVSLNKDYHRCPLQSVQRLGWLVLADDTDVAEFPKFQWISWQRVLIWVSRIRISCVFVLIQCKQPFPGWLQNKCPDEGDAQMDHLAISRGGKFSAGCWSSTVQIHYTVQQATQVATTLLACWFFLWNL